jgi:hypothetical protein
VASDSSDWIGVDMVQEFFDGFCNFYVSGSGTVVYKIKCPRPSSCTAQG